MSLREEQCKKVCRILDDVLANRPTERDSLIVAVQLAFNSLYEPHWIPMKERLPKEKGEYLCQEEQGFLYVDTWDGEYWECAADNFGIVIAWQPLPEPFKGVTE